LANWVAYVERRTSAANPEGWPTVTQDEITQTTDGIRRQKSAAK
jgi:hypothetical protein